VIKNLCGGLLLIFSFSVFAVDSVGIIKVVNGDVKVQRGGVKEQAFVGYKLFENDLIYTAKDGYVGFTLIDDTQISSGPNSSLIINTIKFNSTTHEGNILIKFGKGVFSVITGLISRASPKSTKFTTPTVVVGIRGTEFIVDVKKGKIQ